ncbi:MAG TPA: deoxyribonuclease V [Nitrospirota bacterium]|nr:deoxyribonuclease V [Nitrospirota bacterium]
MKWPTTFTIAEARELQIRLRKRVRITPLTKEPRYVAGVDAAFSAQEVFAAACLYRFPELDLVEECFAVRRLSFPYVPGYLAFREGPAIIAALERLSGRPDLILVDGQGIAHPRGVGIASSLGVLSGIPTIGCAKSRLIGVHDEPGRKKGDWAPLRFENKTIGAVLRTRDDTRPIFISPGHKIDMDSSIRLTLACTGAFRIPEPLRCADTLSKKAKKSKERPG